MAPPDLLSSLKAEIASLKLQSEKEQGDFEGEWKELGRKLEEDRRGMYRCILLGARRACRRILLRVRRGV